MVFCRLIAVFVLALGIALLGAQAASARGGNYTVVGGTKHNAATEACVVRIRHSLIASSRHSI